MACANFFQVSCFAAVPAHHICCYLAVFERVDCAAASSAFPLEERVRELFLRGSIAWALVFGLASVLRFLGVPLGCVRLLVALFFATLRPVPPLGFFPDELPCYPHAMSSQLLAELWGAAVGDENHGHDLLLGDVIEVALVCNVKDPARVLYH